jgi:hypothetical protein
MRYQIVQLGHSLKRFGKKFDDLDEARNFLQTDEQIAADKKTGFTFRIEVIIDE